MRVAVDQVGQEAHALHQLGDAALHFLARGLWLVGDQRLGDDFAHGHARVKRGEWILKDHLNVAAVAAAGLGRHGGEVLALEHRRTAGHRHGADDGAGQR